MCLIIVKPFGKTFDKQHLIEAAKTNTDGIGMSYRVNSAHQEFPTVYVLKKMDTKTAIKDWEILYTNPNIECVIHLRYGTHGSNTIENVHPFETSHGYFMHHNGILNIKTQGNMTDTETYMIEKINIAPDPIRPLDKKWFEDDIGAYNKFVFHTPSGVEFMNEKSGHWNKTNGCWYSNYGYERFDTGWNTIDLPKYQRNDLDELVHEVDALLPNHSPLWKAALIAQLEAYVAATPQGDTEVRNAYDMTDDEVDEWINDIECYSSSSGVEQETDDREIELESA